MDEIPVKTKHNGLFASCSIILIQAISVKMFSNTIFCQKHNVPGGIHIRGLNLELPGKSPDPEVFPNL